MLGKSQEGKRSAEISVHDMKLREPFKGVSYSEPSLRYKRSKDVVAGPDNKCVATGKFAVASD